MGDIDLISSCKRVVYDIDSDHHGRHNLSQNPPM